MVRVVNNKGLQMQFGFKFNFWSLTCKSTFLVFVPWFVSAQAQESMPVSPRVALVNGLVPPVDVELVNEIGLKLNADTEIALDKMAGWIKGTLDLEDKKTLVNFCDDLKEKNKTTESQDWIQKTPACIPRYFEIQSKLPKPSNLKEKSLSPLVGVRKAEDFVTLKGIEFQRAFLALDPQSPGELANYAQFLKPYKPNCDFKGSFAALIARSETFFPSAEAKSVVEEFYGPAFLCLDEKDPGYERTHLRVGLMRVLQGKKEEAKQALIMASQSVNPEEEFRSLFWLGVLNDEPGYSQKSQLPEKWKAANEGIYWSLLRHKYPITIHSILASHALGKDPFARFQGTAPVWMRRRSSSPGQMDANLVSFVFEILISRREFLAADKWSDFVASKLVAPESEEQLLYLAWCHNQVQKHRSAISLLSKYMRNAAQDGYNVALLDMLFPRAYSEDILKETDKIDPVLVFALVRQESAFDPLARSSADARGLMQLLPSTAKRWLSQAHKELYNPSQNIMAGVNYLETLLKRYDGTVEHVLAAYNAGPGNVDRWKRRLPEANTLLFSDLIPFKETRTYVAIILRNAYWYGRLLVQLDDDVAKKVRDLSAKAVWKSTMVHSLLSAAWGQSEQDQIVVQLNGLYNAKKETSLGPIAPPP